MTPPLSPIDCRRLRESIGWSKAELARAALALATTPATEKQG